MIYLVFDPWLPALIHGMAVANWLSHQPAWLLLLRVTMWVVERKSILDRADTVALSSSNSLFAVKTSWARARSATLGIQVDSVSRS